MIVFPLPQPLTAYGAPVAALTRAQAVALRDRPFAGLTPATGYVFVKDGKPNRAIVSCSDLAAAARDGYAPQNNMVNKISESMTVTCGMLDAVIAARPAGAAQTQPPISLAHSTGRISMAALAAIPSEDAAPPPAELAQRDRRSIAQWAHDRHCTTVTATATELQLACDGYLLALTIVLQADIDGTGRDDLVVSPYISSLQGSFSYAGDDLILAQRGTNPLYVPREVPSSAR